MSLPPIRTGPAVPPSGVARPAAVDAAARSAAQRAFFDAALGRADAANPPVSRASQPGVEPSARPLRPGSLLDIRV